MSKKEIQVGLASYGMSGMVFHAPLLVANPRFNLKSIVERSYKGSQEKYPKVRVVKSLENMLEDDEVELAIINTPDSTHYDFAKKALDADKHVVLEKPFTVNKEESEELIDIAKKKNLMITSFQNRRWDGDFLTVQKVIQHKLLGNLVEFESHYDRYRNFIEEDTWKEERGHGGGIVYNLGSHMIDQALVLFGLPEKVTADIRTQRQGGAVDDNYEIVLHYKDQGLKVTLKSGYLVREPGPRYTLHGNKGSFVKYGIDPQEDALKMGKTPEDPQWGVEPKSQWGKLNTEINGLHYEGKIETEAGCYQRFYENIYEVIKNGKPLVVKPEEAMNCIRVIETAIESNAQGKTLNVEY